MPGAERFQRLRAIFEEAVEAPPAERRLLLPKLCQDDPELLPEVEALLASEPEASGYLRGLEGWQGPAGPASPEPQSLIGRRLGAYRIESKLGEGGMSTVYVAARTDLSYRQRVAIKVFGFTPDRSDLLLRFQAERQILASLNHPAMARLLDGGTTPEGLPYLVMELIEGVPIDRYCDRHGLAPDQRIALFLEICAAVSYAHRNLVVHRDLKPANILVDAAGHPKLLDFGIAKLLAGAPVPLDVQATRTGHGLMTPTYASPEQVSGGPITTATDVYSLGVLLYLLLAGRLPYRVEAERPGALERAIAEQAPEPPSQAASPRLRRALAGDLDTVVLTALRKEASKRYLSVDLLAEDLRRHAQGLPVAARPATLGYRLRKFAGRHRAAVAAGSATLLVILGLAAAMSLLAVRLRRERDRAVQVTHFLEEIFRTSDADERHGRDVTARELLDSGGTKILQELRGQPETAAALALTIGKAYRSLGLYERSAALLERSLALRRQRLGEDDPEIADCLDNLAELRLQRNDLAGAEAATRQALTIRGAHGGDGDPALAGTLNDLGEELLSRRDLAGAVPILERALALNRRHFGPADAANVEVLANLAVIQRLRGDLRGAEARYREAIALEGARYGEARPESSVLRSNLGVVLSQAGDLAGAEAAFRGALEVARRLYGGEHPSIALQLNNLATVLVDRGQTAAAEAMYRQALAMQRKLLGNDHEHVAATLNNLADLLEQRGDLRAARPLYEESLEIVRRRYGGDHPRVADQLANLATLTAAEGDPRAAETLAWQALAIRGRRLGAAHPAYAVSLIAVGTLRQARGALGDAEPMLRQGLAILRRTLPPDHPDLAAAESQLGSCLAGLDRPAEAAPLLLAGYRSLERKLGPAHPRTAAARRRLAAFDASRGAAAAAAGEGRARRAS